MLAVSPAGLMSKSRRTRWVSAPSSRHRSNPCGATVTIGVGSVSKTGSVPGPSGGLGGPTLPPSMVRFSIVLSVNSGGGGGLIASGGTGRERSIGVSSGTFGMVSFGSTLPTTGTSSLWIAPAIKRNRNITIAPAIGSPNSVRQPIGYPLNTISCKSLFRKHLPVKWGRLIEQRYARRLTPAVTA